MGVFKKIADYTGALHGVDPTGHNHGVSDITGLQDALDEKVGTDIADYHQQEIEDLRESKADGRVNQVFDNLVALTTQMEGKVLEINNSFHRQLQQIITTQNVHYHLNSATLTNSWFLIRPYRLLSGSNNWFVEVLGAWD